tara:strand:- start:677 stop:1204 length:528 start_codon:yes stop_codon:yes gene_type:complete
MLTHWNKILTADCKVVKVKDKLVYPIFRVGSTSIIDSASEIYTNNEISGLDNILVLLRNPEDRFVSGLNEYCLQNKLDIHTALQMVDAGELMDRHFAPQYIWLLHLSKYHDGSVTLLPFDHIKKLTDLHKRDTVLSRIQVKPLERFVEVDRKLMSVVGQTVMLKPLVKRYKDVLS